MKREKSHVQQLEDLRKRLEKLEAGYNVLKINSAKTGRSVSGIKLSYGQKDRSYKKRIEDLEAGVNELQTRGISNYIKEKIRGIIDWFYID